MKKKCFLKSLALCLSMMSVVSVACACLTVVLFPATQASATIGYSVPSAIITQLDGYTVSCEMTADGTIISVLSSETVPGEKDVNYITKDEQNFRHLEYSGKDYLISVTPADENAFVQEYGQSNGIVRLANGSYILCSKSTEPIIANLSESSADFLHDNRCVSDWSYSDAKASYDQICALKSVDSAKILQGHIQYTYGEGAYSLQLFASAPVTEESFAFLTEGLSVEIDVDDNYPSVTLLKDGKPVDDYAQLYEFYCDILDNIPAVKAVYPCYWYLQFEDSSMVYEVIEEKNAETITDLKTIEVLLKEFIKEKGYDATAAVSEETENVEVVFDQQPEGAEEYDIQAVTQAFRDYCSEKQIDYSLVEVSFLLDSPEATITTTNTTTADTTDFSDTTEISQNSTDSSAVTTSLSGDTETSTTSADLPQTGNHSPRNLLIVLGASWLIGFGMLAVVKSGVIRRRKDEQ